MRLKAELFLVSNRSGREYLLTRNVTVVVRSLKYYGGLPLQLCVVHCIDDRRQSNMVTSFDGQESAYCLRDLF